MNAIHNIANLKDNIKNELKKLNKSPDLVENEINGSIYLQLITDISN